MENLVKKSFCLKIVIYLDWPIKPIPFFKDLDTSGFTKIRETHKMKNERERQRERERDRERETERERAWGDSQAHPSHII